MMPKRPHAKVAKAAMTEQKGCTLYDPVKVTKTVAPLTGCSQIRNAHRRRESRAKDRGNPECADDKTNNYAAFLHAARWA
jgi:hypothetical protein